MPKDLSKDLFNKHGDKIMKNVVSKIVAMASSPPPTSKRSRKPLIVVIVIFLIVAFAVERITQLHEVPALTLYNPYANPELSCNTNPNSYQ